MKHFNLFFLLLALITKAEISVATTEEDNGEVLRSTIHENRNHYVFGTKEANEESFDHWQKFYNALVELSELNNEESMDELAKVEGQKRSFLESVDFYVPDSKRDQYPLYLEGIWMQVACFDEAERTNLMKAYSGELRSPVAPHEEKLSYWKSVFNSGMSDASSVSISSGDEERSESALDAGAYIIHLGISDPLKLEKILYFSQKCHLQDYRTPLFTDSIEGWVHGPVVPSVYAHHRRKVCLKEGDLPGHTDKLSPKQKTSIEKTILKYGRYSPWQLREISHKEEAWLRARDSLSPYERGNVLIKIGDIVSSVSGK